MVGIWHLRPYLLCDFLSSSNQEIKKDKRPTWGESNGKISVGGYIHGVYFSLTLAMTIMCLYSMVVEKLNLMDIVFVLVGILIWSVSCLMDVLVGNFAPLKKDE